MDIRLALMTGIDIPIPELQLTIHQPTIKEIAYIGETDFFIGLQTLNVNTKMLMLEDKTVLENTSNFQIFMTIINEAETKDKKEAIMLVLSLIFPNCKVIFTPQSLLLSSEQGMITIDEGNFEILQQYIQEIFCLNSAMHGDQNFNPADKKAEEIAKKLMRGRQRVAAQKGEDNGSVFGRYVSIITVGINSMSFFDSLNLTMYQMYDLVERYTLHLNWDLDIKTRLAGGKPDSKPDDWMKNIH